ncbi:PBP1A family penicillin-binding protein [Faunimonas sp. B44]|uniref:PBP1A family penicillin-binding protein n=1 Tax=Faunimonas sp. B44 TaxID=3461493 RepID=UPI00404438CE
MVAALAAVFAIFLLGTIVAAGTALWALRDVPLASVAEAETEPSILIEAADGEPLTRRGPIQAPDAPIDAFPKHLVDAVLSIEDRRFYDHSGIDFRGILRAAIRNYSAGGIVEGGSTITQQLVKIEYLDRERTYGRKLREVALSVWLDRKLEKDEILARYLNGIYLGAGATGMPTAARIYFDKEVSELTLAESALLAGLIKAPSQLNPLRNFDAARRRAAVVLDSMVADGRLDAAAAEEAKANPAVLHQPKALQGGSWFTDWIFEEASDLAGSFRGGMRIRTTLIPALQDLAEEVVGEALAGGAGGPSQAALVALKPDGAVMAMVGGRDYGESVFNRATQAKRQPGSTFKLFVYLAALRSGLRPDDIVEDAPLEIDGWKPENFGGRYHGRVTLAQAFARSLNTATVRLADGVGILEVARAARDLGIDAPLGETPSLALGTSEVTLLDLTGAYASVRAGVAPIEPWGIAAFGPEEQGQLMTSGPPVTARQSLADVHEPLVGLLRLVVESGTGREAALDGFAAGKTGTSQNHRDAWFVGFNEHIVVGVWVGNDDGSPMDDVTGGTLPAQIWKTFVTRAMALARAAPPAPAQEIPSAQEQDAPVAEAPPAEPEAADPDIPVAAAEPPPPAADEAPQEVPVPAAEPAADPAGSPESTVLSAARRATAPAEPAPDPTDQQRLEAMATGSVPVAGAVPTGQTDQPAAMQCNYRACSRFYRSFRASDCTYQPYRGSRRICER